MAQECQRRYPSIELVRLTPEGGIHYQYREDVLSYFTVRIDREGRRLHLEAAP